MKQKRPKRVKPAELWAIADCNGRIVVATLWSKERAEIEARYHDQPWPLLAPHRVVRVIVRGVKDDPHANF